MNPSASVKNLQSADDVQIYEVAEVAALTDDSASTADAETTEADDPLTLFSWQIRHRATSPFTHGCYEVRMVIGPDEWIRSGESFDGLMAEMREEAARVVKQLES